MLYLLDANVLITANSSYYPIDVVPEFWDWLLHLGQQNRVKVPFEILEEITVGRKDPLVEWLKSTRLPCS